MCIRLYGAINNGYNIHKGGYNAEFSEQTRNKMSKNRKGKPKPHDFGSKISKALRGRKQSESHKHNNRQAQINCKAHHEYRHTEETKLKMSSSGKGKPKPDGFGVGVATRNMGRKASKETKKKMSQKRQGRKPALGMKHTKESKMKISEGVKNSDKVGRKILIFCENNGKTYSGCRSAAQELGIKKQHIYDFFHGKTKTAKGFKFKKF